jgi:hypothetical protein
MATLVMGDLHLKQPFVLPCLLNHILCADEAVKRIVFLGDACDDWGTTPHQAIQALDYYADWVDARRAEGIQVDVLLGNHDMCYIRGRRGSGTMLDIMQEVRDLLQDRLQVKLATTLSGYLCCHAGLTLEWAQEYLPADVIGDKPDAQAIAELLNSALGNSAYWPTLDCAGPSRGGRDKPGPVWADLSDLQYDALPDLNQMVGHTPVIAAGMPEMTNWLPGEAPMVWACDSMSLTRSGRPIGDGSFLSVSDEGEVSRVAFPTADPDGYAAVVRRILAAREQI